MFEIGFELSSLYIEVEIDYKIWSGEKEVRYYSDGSGNPGSPPELEILEVYVTSVSGETYEKTREEIGWISDLDRLAQDYIEDNIEEFTEKIFELEADCEER